MKKLFTILICICTIYAKAQTPGNPIGGIVVKGGRNPGGSMLISLDGGITNPTKPTKDGANLSNLTNINVGAYVPLTDFGRATKGVINKTLGINFGGGYLSGNKDYNLSPYTPINISGQSGSPTVSANGAGSPKQQGFKFESGAQANFSFGDVTISPILNGSYLSLKQQAFTITQTSTVNGKTADYNLYTQAETKTSGFAVIPKLRVAYFPGKLGLFVEGNYTAGPTINNETTFFKPQGDALKDGSYNIDQMLLGTNQALPKSTKYDALGFNFGLSYALSKKGFDSYKAHSDMASAKAQNPLYEDKSGSTINPLAERRVEVLKSNKEVSNPSLDLMQTNDQENCNPSITSPKQSQRFNLKEKIRFAVNFSSAFTGEKNVRVYKVSDNPDYLGTLTENQRNEIINPVSLSGGRMVEQSIKGKAITKSLSASGAGFATNLDRLDEGSYIAFVGNGTCNANPVSFSVSSALHRLDVLIDTAKCTGFNAAGKPVYSINITLKNFSTPTENVTYDVNNALNVAQNVAIPGNIITNIVYAGAAGTFTLAASTYPTTLGPGAQQTFTINYVPTNVNATCLNLEIYISSKQGATVINDNTFSCIPVKPCTCNYCDNIKWEFSKEEVTATTQATNNSINISTTIASPNVMIKYFKAELISFIHVAANGTEECFGCNKDSNTFGNFTSGTFTSSGWEVQNGLFPVIPSGGGNTHHTLSWFSLSPPVTQLAGSQVSMNISAPPFSTLACCDDVIKFCIRYSFTNRECQTCSFVKCYVVTRKHK
ncbi:hypothetical protein EZ449_07820 [Pedobacter frigidisoli]|uniref:Uncharacterized protein n=1 Tax=Pedobacter frigidisoli TaxID=2530455 RepID=A0A4R0P5W1_9SPHI|nr:hypothetical protein [Pedobacter frigidisoli]TCD10786.1 hypothetical protein EZ449_07820 [Pedobacter frigidisoli]